MVFYSTNTSGLADIDMGRSKLPALAHIRGVRCT